LPSFLFILQFYEYEVSSKVSDWASLGDFLGGTTNTLISFISLIVLSYLTYVVSKQSNEENKKTNLLLRKFDAYDNLLCYLPIINSLSNSMPRDMKLVSKKIKEANTIGETIQIDKREVISSAKKFIEFNHFLFNFYARYGHIFKYDFTSKNYNDLIDNSNRITDFFNSIIDSYQLNFDEVTNKEIPDFAVFFNNLAEFVNSLKNELK